MSRVAILSQLLVPALLVCGCATSVGPIQGAGTVADPVQIPLAPGTVTIDGDLSEWKAIGVMPLPYMQKPASSMRFCWSAEGLYGAVAVKDEDIEVNASKPWEGDCLEVWVEKDFARAADRTKNSAQYVFAPEPAGKTGAAHLVIPYGGEMDKAEDVRCAWMKSADGYTLEFLIPAKLMAPAKMAPGTKIGLNFALDDGGQRIEQFYGDENASGAYRRPNSWGAAILAK